MNDLRRQQAINNMRAILSCPVWSCDSALTTEKIEDLAAVILAKREVKKLKRKISRLKKCL